MKNRIKFLGIIVLSMIIGFSMTACGDGGGGGPTIVTGEPTSNILSGVGLESAKFATLKSISGYYAYMSSYHTHTEYNNGDIVSIKKYPQLGLLYKEQSVSGFTSAKTTLNSLFSLTMSDVSNGNLPSGFKQAEGSSADYMLTLTFVASTISEDGITLPANSIFLVITYNNEL